MNIKKQPLSVRLLISAGLLIATLPMLLKHFIPLPDFLHGFMAGAGVGLEIMGLIKLKQYQRRGCHETESY